MTKGILIYPNGASYDGDLREGRYDGYGKLNYANGDQYMGDWLKGKKWGSGIFKFANGIVCEGVFNNDNLMENATIIYPDGDRFVGDWDFDHKCRQGFGTYI